MRTRLFALVLLSLAATAAHAQDWANPLVIGTNPYVDYRDDCPYPPRQLVIEYGAAVINSPAVIYRVSQRSIGRGAPSPWHLTLTPYTYTDFSLFVCKSHNGDQVWDCVDAQDNWGAVPEHATVPGIFGVYWVIVAGNVGNVPPSCGTYALNATH